MLEIHETKPEDFIPHVQVAACYLEIEDKLLLLQQPLEKPQPGKWGVPGGKLEANESPQTAAKRELLEETGISIQDSQLQHISTLYFRKPGVDYTYHIFKVHLHHLPTIQLSPEHQNYTWATPQDLQNLPLRDGGKKVLQHYYKALKRPTATINVYLILKQNDKILFHLRKNTGYCDGMWSLIAGHVEANESATAAMIREAREEIGIDPLDLKVVHVMHRKTNRYNIDIFFTCSTWKGTIQNCEPEKCEKLEFFPLTSLPPNTVDYNISALLTQEPYSELGWNP